MANLAANSWPVKLIELGTLAGYVSPQYASGIPDPPPGQYFHEFVGDIYSPPPPVFTPIQASFDTRKIYLSHELGDNNFNGLAPTPQGGNVGPKKTADAAFSLMRQGYPDHVLIRRGEIESGRPKWWDIRHFSVANVTRGGRSDVERSVIGWYGTGHKPRIAAPQWGSGKSFINVIGLHIYTPTGVIGDPAFNASCETFSLLNGPSGILIEDCWVSASEITAQNQQSLNMQNIAIRYCNLIDPVFYKQSATNNSSRPSFVYSSNIKNLLIEGCIIAYPGWHPEVVPNYGGDSTITGAASNMFNHGLYIAENNVHEGPKVMRNLIYKPSANGWQLRSGGVAMDNIVYGASVASGTGYYDRGDPLKGLMNDGRLHRIVRNVLLNTEPMYRMLGGCAGPVCTGAIWGLDVGVNNFKAVYELLDNVVAGKNLDVPGSPPSINTNAKTVKTFIRSGDMGAVVRERNNALWHFDNSTQGDDQGYLDPTRSISSAMLALNGVSMTDEQAMRVLALRDTYAYHSKSTVLSFNEHIRQGFQR